MATLHKPDRSPLFLKLSLIAVGTAATLFVLSVGREIFLPLCFSLLFAILLNPLVNILTHRKVNRIVAIALALIVGVLFVLGLLFFVGAEAMRFSSTLPLVEQRFNGFIEESTLWLSTRFHLERAKIDEWVAHAKSDGLTNGMLMLTRTISTLTGVMLSVVLVPVYVFMLLYYKPMLLDFVGKLFERDTHLTVAEVLLEIKVLVQSYLRGLLIEAVLMTTMYTIAWLLIGLPYALLLAVMGALLNLIPYIGGLIGALLPVLLALATKSYTAALLVMGSAMVIQFIDNHYIQPMIVASRVRLNALLSVIMVLTCGTLWGVPGMFLAIPMTGILKVVLDRVEPLKPWGFLLGDNLELTRKPFFNLTRLGKRLETKAAEEKIIEKAKAAESKS